MATAPAIREVIESIDPQVPMEQQPLDALVSQSVADRRFLLVVIGTFATVALLLAVVGIHAVVSYTVAQRNREIGVRLALGATPGQVRAHVILDAMKSIVPGLFVGALLAIGATSALRSFLYGVSPLDPAALGAAVVMLAAAGVASSLWPAFQATRIDPLLAIRSE